VSPRQFLNSDTRFSELINLDTASWKSEIIDALFLPFEANIIKSIPLSSRLPVDKQLWAKSSNGLFSMRSTYAIAMRMSQKATNGAPSDSNQQLRFQNQIWNLPLPHKLWHFTWRVCWDILPTKVNLMKRKVVQDAYCEECRTKAESIQHVLWTCPKAKEAWECSKMVVSMRSSRCQNFQDLMWLMMMEDLLEVDKIARVVRIAWA